MGDGNPTKSAWQPQKAALLAAFLQANKTSEARVSAMADLLRGPAGAQVRSEMGQWIVALLEELIPDAYTAWRLLVQDAMMFVVLNLSNDRLAPKLVEQIELPPNTRAEKRLLHLIAKVPGLQKVGQVLARNRNLQTRLRQALSKLENGISDVSIREIRPLLHDRLGQRLQKYEVRIASRLLSEASVSAVVRFTWKNPESGRREPGVFKVLKPYIPAYYAEDMDLLLRLAVFLARNHRKYGVASGGLADTFQQVRRLLQHEVDFAGEQRTLAEANQIYGSMPGVSVPGVIEPLCARTVTALTEERGAKITSAVRGMAGWQRRRVALQLIETLIATPLLASESTGPVLFHADPHAGNLLYDRQRGVMVVLDWALTAHLTRNQRRQVALLFLATTLRDPVGVFHQVRALSQRTRRRSRRREKLIRQYVEHFIDELSPARLPGSMDAMRLLQRLAFKGVKLPAELVLLRKVMFTLDGILHDIVGAEVQIDLILMRHLLWRWLTSWKALGSPLSVRDWMSLPFSALLLGGRWGLQAAHHYLDPERKNPVSRERKMPDRAGSSVSRPTRAGATVAAAIRS